MAKMTEQQKKVAAGCAVGMNDTGALFGGAAIAVGPFSIGSGIVLGIGAVVATYLGDRYSEMANDPPRLDFDQVARFERVALELREAGNEAEAALQDFLREELHLAKASSGLIMSLERQQGAESVLRGEIGSDGDRERARDFELLQREALLQNMSAYSELVGNLLNASSRVNNTWRDFRREQLGPQLNAAWIEYKTTGLSGGTPLITDVQQTRDRMRELRERLDEAKEEYKLAEFGVTDTSALDWYIEHPTTAKLPPETLITQDWLETMRKVRELDLTTDDSEPTVAPITSILRPWPPRGARHGHRRGARHGGEAGKNIRTEGLSAVRRIRGRLRRNTLAPSSFPYSPSCLEEEISEVHIQDPAYPRSYKARIAALPRSSTGGRSLYLVVLDRYALSCIAPAQSGKRAGPEPMAVL